MAMENISASRLAEKTQTQLDQAELDNKLSNLKSQDLANAVVNVYVTKISTSNKDKRFISVKRLNLLVKYSCIIPELFFLIISVI